MIAERVGFFWWRDVIRALREEVGYTNRVSYGYEVLPPPTKSS